MGDEDGDVEQSQMLKKIHGAIQRCMIILEYDGLMCQRRSFTRGELPNLTVFVFWNGRYPTVAKVHHAHPFPTEPGSLPGLVPIMAR